LSSPIVHLIKTVVSFIITPVDEDGTVIDIRAILDPAFEADMGGE